MRGGEIPLHFKGIIMAYSTVAQLRSNIPQITTDELTDNEVKSRTTEGDKDIRTDLSSLIDFDLVPDTDPPDSTNPEFLNKLSQFKTCEYSLVALHGANRKVQEVSDVQYWQKKYEDYLAVVLSGKIPIELGDGTSIIKSGQRYTQDSKADVKPALGTDKNGEFLTETELEDLRPLN
jgi:hypothetical protein